jgi:hypothetical protein
VPEWPNGQDLSKEIEEILMNKIHNAGSNPAGRRKNKGGNKMTITPGKTYVWTGEKKRQRGWNDGGRMDYVLRGPLYCKGVKDDEGTIVFVPYNEKDKEITERRDWYYTREQRALFKEAIPWKNRYEKNR